MSIMILRNSAYQWCNNLHITILCKQEILYVFALFTDRVNKSDTEDKSLSNDETPLPSCPRQPPDGVETPSEVIEKIPEPPTRLPPLHFIRPRYSYSSRTQDARSEASVKDKIAMFSNDHAASTDRLDKCGTLPTRNGYNTRKNISYLNYSEVSSLDRRLTKSQDNLDEMPRYCKKPLERPEVSGGLGNTIPTSNYDLTKTLNRSLYSENKPLFYGSTTTLPSSTETSLSHPVYHMRSTSDDTTSKSTSSHKSNLEYLIEQRKKSMSKLRGLVIPEIQGPLIGLPEIKVQDNITKSFLLKTSEKSVSNKTSSSKINSAKPVIINETKWKTILPNNLPKYSPAFKRKSLQVYTPTSLSKESTPERNFSERIDILNKINNKSISNKPVRATLDYNDTPKHLTTSILPSKPYITHTSYSLKKDIKENLNYIRDYKNFEAKICTITDIVDSDNDSAMSSTQSSYRSSASSPMHTLENIESDSSRLSPRISNYTYSVVKSEMPAKISTEKSYEDYMKRTVCRSMSSDTNVSLSSSAGSAATSGSQASCSSLESSVADSDKRKVSKTYNVDTLNRRNILASAKCRSGRDNKLNSPVIEAKFSHESSDRSPSPAHKASERLSTLTPTVSAVSNKGDNRRRNKIIAETDSDSDSDLNIRQRKTDFKNSRLKRSSSNKTKSTETNSESPKAEDAPRVISEKIIKEIKKAGLDNFTSNKSTTMILDKKSFDIIKSDNIMIKKEENNVKNGISQNHKDVSDKADLQLKEKPSLNQRYKAVPDSKPDKKDSVQDAKISTRTIRLKRGAGTGVGVILAGGIDCEAKDVTVRNLFL